MVEPGHGEDGSRDCVVCGAAAQVFVFTERMGLCVPQAHSIKDVHGAWRAAERAAAGGQESQQPVGLNRKGMGFSMAAVLAAMEGSGILTEDERQRALAALPELDHQYREAQKEEQLHGRW